MRQLTILLCFLSIFAKGQTCLPSGITFTNQSQIDNFPSNFSGCTKILGGVFIRELSTPSITNLDSLHQLTEIVGFLTIDGNNNLIDLDGLENLTSVGGQLAISTNSLLSDLQALANLTSVGGNLTLGNNPNLNTLTGLNNIITVGGRLSVSNIPLINNLNGLNGITSLGDRLAISENSNLVNLSGLENLILINGQLSIVNNDLLTDISSLSNIDPSTIMAATTSPDIIIIGNALLSNCAIQSICDALVIPGTIGNFSSNNTGCNNLTEVETACLPLPLEWTKPLKGFFDNGCYLSWSVIHQINNDYFLIERRDFNNSFQPIDKINLSNLGGMESDYVFNDYSPLTGLNYYRVKQVDLDGQYSYSNTVAINTTQTNSELCIFPNPSSGTINIKSNRNSSAQILNNFGIVIQEISINSKNEFLRLTILEAGLYFIITDNGLIEKFLIQN